MWKEEFLLGDCRIKPQLNTIVRQNEVFRLEPKVMQVLLYLASQPKKVISRIELLENVWPDSIVVDMVLTRAISELRNTFQDDPYHPKYIETIPKSGYRLIASIEPISTVEELPLNQHKEVGSRFWPVIASVALLICATLIWSIQKSEPTKALKIKPFTNKKGWEFHPSISPQGQFAVFVWYKEKGQFGHIYVKSMVDASSYQLTATPSTYLRPIWSADGKSIYYYQNDKGQVSINRINALGGEPQFFLSTQAQVAGLSFAPDGKALYYIDRDTLKNFHAIFQYDFPIKTSRQISNPPADVWGDVSPQISPNGQLLAFIRIQAEGDEDIYLINQENQKTIRITNFNANIFGFNWEPDGESLMFSSNFGGSTYLWRVKVSGDSKNTPSQIHFLSLEDNFQNPSIYKNQLLVENWSAEADLKFVNLLGEKEIELFAGGISSSSWELHPSISSDGNQIAFSSKRSGYYNIWTYNLQTGNTKMLLEDQSSQNKHPVWSPHDDQIAFEKKQKGQSNIYLLHVNTNHLIPLITSSFEDKHPSWSNDGKYLYFSSNRTGNWEIWRQSIFNEQPHQISFKGGYIAKESPNGEHLFYTKAKVNGIWQSGLHGKSEQLIIPELLPPDWGNWSVTKKGIYFIKRQKGKTQVCFYDYQLKESKLIKDLAFNVPTSDPAFAVSFDGKWALIGKFKSYNGDLLLLEDY